MDKELRQALRLPLEDLPTHHAEPDFSEIFASLAFITFIAAMVLLYAGFTDY